MTIKIRPIYSSILPLSEKQWKKEEHPPTKYVDQRFQQTVFGMIHRFHIMICTNITVFYFITIWQMHDKIVISTQSTVLRPAKISAKKASPASLRRMPRVLNKGTGSRRGLENGENT